MRPRGLALAVGLWLAAAGPLQLAAQGANTGIIQGRVATPAGAAVAQAELLATHLAGFTRRQGTSSRDGSFWLPFLPPVNYRLTVRRNGYRPVVNRAARGFNFPVRPQLFTIKYVGGWASVEKKFFDPHNGVMAKIQGSSGG